jgi:long-chain fatty acid transport protein
MQRFRGWAAALLALALSLGAAPAASGAGFGIFEHGTKAMGMAGAFTAQADDPSAMFHNVAGLAFQKERQFLLGATIITSTEAELQGGSPFPGRSYSAEQESLFETPAHLYYVHPLGGMTFGLGVNTPFGLTTEWQDKSQFAGRYLSTMAALRTFDINPSLAWQLGNFAVGIGGIARISDVELERRAGIVNPFTFRVVDVANTNIESDLDNEGYGWNAGLLHRWNNSFSWGLSYRSGIDVDYAGTARFSQISTGNPQLDAVVARQIPFNQDLDVETEISFPELASLGLAFAITPNLLVETDANWTGWSSFDEVPITFVDVGALSAVLPQEWDDAYNYRLGIRWSTSARNQLRFGYVFDESPQPDEGVGPLLPDADRNGFTVGFGHQGSRFTTDVAVMYLPFEERETRTNRDQFNGTYNTTAWLFGLSLGF